MDLEQTAIARLRMASDMSLRLYKQPLVITYSGGKDSDVLLHLAGKAGEAPLVRRADGLDGRIVKIVLQRSGRLHEDAAGITRDAVRSRLKAAAAGRTCPVVPVAAAAVSRAHIAHLRHRHRRRHIHLCPVGKAVFGRERLRIDHTQSLLTKQSFAA